MLKKILVFLCILFLFQADSQARNTVSYNITLTIPIIPGMNAPANIPEPSDTSKEIIIIEEEFRDGEQVILETVVPK